MDAQRDRSAISLVQYVSGSHPDSPLDTLYKSTHPIYVAIK
jgi:hypothetical protein